ncbi:MAG: hypothetical protein PHY90_04145 [Desulfitobacteriaceae bacterium]|nr:hypothetical protein [Desulfitobacteriaceae bacterium]
MIKIVERITASAMWDIDGAQITLPYRKEYPEPIMAKEIKALREILQSYAYKQDNSGLCTAFQIFSGISFVAIGMTVPDDFLACFAYYAKQFAKEWAEGEKCLQSKFIGYEYVFQKMLQNEAIPIKYDFRYILNKMNGEPFCQVNEQAFAAQWIPTLLPLMEQGLSLASAAKRVGDVRISKYLMQIPAQTECYLNQLATAYTARRELISLSKMNAFILGSDSRANFTGAAPEFL